MPKDNFEKKLTPIGIHRVGLTNCDVMEDIEYETQALLARTLNTGNVLAFIGSGVSSGCKLPDWDELIITVIEYVLIVASNNDESKAILYDGETAALLIEFLAQKYDKAENFGSSIPASVFPHINEIFNCELMSGGKPVDLITAYKYYHGDSNSGWRKINSYLKKPSKDCHVSAENYLMIAECCRKTMERLESLDNWPTKAKTIDYVINEKITKYGNEPHEEPELGVIKVLHKQLHINRFLTTNYDLLIERALNSDRESEFSPLSKALKYDPNSLSQLIEFGFGHKPKRCVLHLHGMINDDGPLVIAERDYQRLYLREDRRSRQYRDIFESILEAHPILFIGAGMKEEDVLRPFRRFLAERRPDEMQRPLFALLPKKTGDDVAKLQERRRYLYSRHGVKVLFFEMPDDEKSKTLDQNIEAKRLALENKLIEIAKNRRSWWRSWRRKPGLRERQFDERFIHGNSFERLKDKDWVWNLGDEYKAIFERPATFIAGQMGAGKGRLIYDLTQHAKKHFPNGGEDTDLNIHVANIAFTNDFLTVLEQIANRIEGTADPGDGELKNSGKAPVDYFFEALLAQKEKTGLCILGGFDRILYRRSAHTRIVASWDENFSDHVQVPIGDPVDVDVHRFLKKFIRYGQSTDSNIHLVITSSVVPQAIIEKGVQNKVAVIPLVRGKVPLPEENALSGPLKSHSFALHTYDSAKVIIDDHILEDIEPELERKITAMSEEHRPMQVVSAIVKGLERSDFDPKMRTLLEDISFFHAPVDISVLKFLYKGSQPDAAEPLVKKLTEIGLLVETVRKSSGDSDDFCGYCAHPVTRLHFNHSCGRISDITFEPHLFTMSVFAHDNNENILHSESAHRRALNLLNKLMARAREIIRGSEPSVTSVPFIRAAFSLFRFYWSAVSIPRMAEQSRHHSSDSTAAAYDSYANLLAQLHNLIRDCNSENYWSPNRWKNTDVGPKFSNADALYANELVWLYNESGMVAYCAGEMTDAHSHFHAAQIISRKTTRAENTYHYLVTELNLALTAMDQGNLNYATNRLSKLLEYPDVQECDFGNTIKGYLGIICFYRGDTKKALKLLSEALRDPALLDANNRSNDDSLDHPHSVRYKRRASIFLRFRCNLYLDEYEEEAIRDLDRSLALAQAANQPDLIFANHITRARCYRVLGGPQESWDLLTRCREFAWRLGSTRLEVDVNIQQAQSAFMQGNGVLAAKFANLGITKATSCKLALKKTNCIVLQACALLNQMEVDDAVKVLDLAKEKAKRQGYQQMLHEIDILETQARSANRPNLLLL